MKTGIIERIYTLDRGVTEMLIEHGIDSSLIPHDATDLDPELVTAIIRDHKSAVDWLCELVRGDRPLSTSFIKELHALMTQHQRTASGWDQFGRLVETALLHGERKRLPNNPTRPDESTHEYCPPEQVAQEMDRLVELHDRHVAAGAAPEVEAAWLHHRFTQIHPFQDGNGRVARAIASLVFLRAGWFPLLGYFANNRDYRAWVRLKLVAGSEAFILLSLTAVGREFRGVIAASLAFFWRDVTEEGQGRVVGVTPASDEVFQINYKEAEASVVDRFDRWFESALACALEMWRRGL